ncbi:MULTISPECIES: helix-turn-helix transcriptional regulator [unclassified Streptomyces]|uniref:ArsR/SmtB family transcription factor n=1 Tax=unclassified Streptomyces TaxID=2593676 RepID=UPI001BE556C0|nr:MULTISPECIES: metalloregulator ArsR/SmtB family transcription factor [unclassified Streptomyces]MBT2407886.1 helix-turn-helix transcriptional regulator [Streptomyces sp. ISL-21]MBT2608424.1 helix-turn-helix transcriptional regulator [Streptomyces sp. ISL-87]
MREVTQPAAAEIKLVEVFHALADPVRLQIVAQLAEKGRDSCSGVGESIDLHRTTMSHHYRVLRESGVTWTEMEGRTRYVSLRRKDLDARFPGLLDAVLAQLL